MSKTILETNRLILREFTQNDLEALGRILKDPEVMHAYEHGFSDKEVQEWLNRQIGRYQNDGFGLWAVVLKETKELIGQCGITLQDAEDKNGKVKEVGYQFAKAFWHCGYAMEAAIACRDYAFETLEADEIYSIIREKNQASERVAERNGMRRCGSLVKYYYGMDMPHNIYKITKKEWQEQNRVDAHSYQFGVIDCFNEMVHAGLKKIAMSHPCKTKEERDFYFTFCYKVCAKYDTHWYPEDEAFLTDLFPEELNRDTYNIIFYRVKEDLDAYLDLKKKKAGLVVEKCYTGEERHRIAVQFGKLLSYSEESIERKISETTKKSEA